MRVEALAGFTLPHPSHLYNDMLLYIIIYIYILAGFTPSPPSHLYTCILLYIIIYILAAFTLPYPSHIYTCILLYIIIEILADFTPPHPSHPDRSLPRRSHGPVRPPKSIWVYPRETAVLPCNQEKRLFCPPSAIMRGRSHSPLIPVTPAWPAKDQH